MTLRLFIVVAVVAATGFFFWRWKQPSSAPTAPGSMVDATVASVAAPVSTSSGRPPAVSATMPPSVADQSAVNSASPPAFAPGNPLPGPPPAMPIVSEGTPPAPPPGRAEVNPELVATDLDSLSLSLRDYRTIAAQNPIGTNLEITEALMGKNRNSARLAPEDARVNAKGEMVDRWGTAYFFHQLSATAMEIHSAGPDQRMGTDDDIIHR